MARGATLAITCLLAVTLWTPAARGGEPKAPEQLRAEIDALKVPNIAWRQIAWKSCLLEGLQESRAKHRPVLLWVFIDRPVDDARC
jgi:hypothetical protein